MKYFRIPVSFAGDVASLSDKERGRLFKAMLQYAETGIEPELRGNERFLWETAKANMSVTDTSRNGQKKKDHWNWKGGITPKNQTERHSAEYRRWRCEVFARDNYTCQCCGQRGGKLNAHHIKPWAKDIEARYDTDNGITLCELCHKFIHGRK